MIPMLKALKLVDEDNTLSLSNLLLLVIIIKIAVISAVDWATLGSLAVIVLNHNARKMFRAKHQDKTVSSTSELENLSASVAELSQQVNLMKLNG